MIHWGQTNPVNRLILTNQPEDGIYVIHPDGSGLKQLSSMDAMILDWIGSSVAVHRRTNPYPAMDAAIELL